MLTRRDAKMIAKELVVISPNNDIDPNEVYLTIDQAAEFLHLAKRTLYNLGEKIPRCKRGKRVYYKRSALQRFIERKEAFNEMLPNQ